MSTLKLFKNGTSQAVRIPKEMEFKSRCVRMRRHQGGLLILPEDETWNEIFERMDELGPSTIEIPDDPPPEAIE